jgi:hypothetical protein
MIRDVMTEGYILFCSLRDTFSRAQNNIGAADSSSIDTVG